MCLAIPGRVAEIGRKNGLLVGRIDYSGAINKVCLEYVPEVTVGQYVLVHAGFAISILNEQEAMETLKLWDELMQYCSDEQGAVLQTAVIRKPASGDPAVNREVS